MEAHTHYVTDCNQCDKGEEDNKGNFICKKRLCNICRTCDEDLYSFGDELDFDLCPECLKDIQQKIQEGLIIIKQKDPTLDIPEQIVIIREKISEAVRKKVFDRDNWKCVKCGSSEYLQVDHKFPFARGGTIEIDNLQTLCKKCNIAKKDSV